MAEITLKYIFLKELSQTPHQAHLMGNKREKKKKKEIKTKTKNQARKKPRQQNNNKQTPNSQNF